MSIKEKHNFKEQIIKHIDIRGKVCPMTFVYTKLALEDLNKGEILEVLLNFPAALKSIPENVKRQNLAKVLEIEEKNRGKDEWILKLMKL
ncbi:MAG: sulfurtransferase TusA family protein [Promethearchaeota archaeon]